jgi:hypothetical protein
MLSANNGPRFQRPAPPKYSQKFQKMSLSDDTAQLYAMLEYFDDQVCSWMYTCFVTCQSFEQENDQTCLQLWCVCGAVLFQVLSE